MTARVRTYRLVLPPPWERISLTGDPRGHVQRIVDDVAARHTPRDVPPDQVGPRKREVVELMMRQVEAARDRGGLDLYLPLGDLGGFSVAASFVVSEVTPSATMTAEEVPQVLASLLSDGTATPVTIDGSTWVRRELTVEPTDEVPVPARRTEYVVPVPGSPRHWLMVSFSAAGPPLTNPADPDDETDLMTVLFDAIMSTWRWEHDGPTTDDDASGDAHG